MNTATLNVKIADLEPVKSRLAEATRIGEYLTSDALVTLVREVLEDVDWGAETEREAARYVAVAIRGALGCIYAHDYMDTVSGWVCAVCGDQIIVDRSEP